MYRRISQVFDFKQPNYLERLEIWKLVTAHSAIPCCDDIDWEAVALKYELTGGFIKNAVISALLSAVGRDPENPCITEDDVVAGCRKQVRGALQMTDFDQRVLPQAGLDDFIGSNAVCDKLQSMIRLEKARGVLFGQWGFNDEMRSRQGTTALFWGVAGVGRSRAAEAVGFELGKPLKVVDFSSLIVDTARQNDDKSSSAIIKDIFKEARLMDAVLVLDGYQLELDDGGSSSRSGHEFRLLNQIVREMSRFPGVVILMVTTTGQSLDVFMSRLDKDLLRSLKFLIEFEPPDRKSRERLWERCLPASVPRAANDTFDFKALAAASAGFSLVQIGNAVYRAAAVAALRAQHERAVRMTDLQAAVQDEKERCESEIDRFIASQYM